MFPLHSLKKFVPGTQLKISTHLLVLGLSILLGLGLFTRLYKLNSVPISLYFDEMDYVVTGESIVHWGSDLSGNWQPLQLRPVHTMNYTAELAAVFHAFFQGIFGTGPATAHIPAAVFGLLSIVALCGLIWRQTRSSVFVLVVAAMMTVNPWHTHISRMGYEAVISVFFQIAFLFSLWLISQKKVSDREKALGLAGLLISLFFSFYTYHGAKFTMLILSAAAIIWLWWQPLSRRWKMTTSVVLTVTLLILLGRTAQLQRAGAFGDRSGEIITSQFITPLVDEQRRLSLNFPGMQLITNKYTVGLKEIGLRYISVFDTYRLLGTGNESGYQFSLSVYGFFHLSTFPFLLFGFHWWFRRYPTAARFLMLFLIVSPFTSAVTTSFQAIFRSALTYVLIIAFASGGVMSTWEWLAKQSKKKALLGFGLGTALFVLLVTEAAIFSLNYFTRYPILTADKHYFLERLLAGYVGRVQQPILVVTNSSAYNRSRSILAYTQTLSTLTPAERQQFANAEEPEYHFGSVTVTVRCPNFSDFPNTIQVVEADMFENCHYREFLATSSAQPKNAAHQIELKSISSPSDSGTYFHLFNDPICEYEKLQPYVYTNNIDDFDPLSLTDEKFCQTWVKREVK